LFWHYLVLSANAAACWRNVQKKGNDDDGPMAQQQVTITTIHDAVLADGTTASMAVSGNAAVRSNVAVAGSLVVAGTVRGQLSAEDIASGVIGVAQGGTGTTMATGVGHVVLANAPTLSNPNVVGNMSVSGNIDFTGRITQNNVEYLGGRTRLQAGSRDASVTGDYLVTFTREFPTVPIVMLTVDGARDAVSASTFQVSTTGFGISVSGNPSSLTSIKWLAIA
jgi:hypothetical protein